MTKRFLYSFIFCISLLFSLSTYAGNIDGIVGSGIIGDTGTLQDSQFEDGSTLDSGNAWLLNAEDEDVITSEAGEPLLTIGVTTLQGFESHDEHVVFFLTENGLFIQSEAAEPLLLWNVEIEQAVPGIATTADGDIIIPGSILANTGTLTLGGTGGTNNENITFDFESVANRVILGSDSGAQIRFGANVIISDNTRIRFGTDADGDFTWETEGNDNLQLGLKVGDATFSGYFSLVEKDDIGTSTRSPISSWPNGATPADPTFAVLSADETEALDILAWWHDQTDPHIGWGNGSLTLVNKQADTLPILTLENTGGDFQIFRDDASPESVITGSIGDLTLDTTNGGLYLKISGSATNTGWEQIGGTPSFKSYSLANPGNAGTFYIGGHYAFAAGAANLEIGVDVTETFGSAGQAHGSHAFCVASGAGGTDLVLTVTGVSISDAGARNDSDEEIIVADTDAAITDQYFETTRKWLGQITYTLTGSSGTFDFNYGFVKYEDFGNRGFTVTDFDMTGETRANETGLNIELLYHEAGAFVYDGSSFVPNQTALVSLATDYGTNNDVASGDGFAYKRSGLSTAIDGASGEGLIIRITTAVNNSINDATAHIGVTLN